MSPIDLALAERLTVALAAGPAALCDVLSGLFKALPGIRTVTYLSIEGDATRRIGTSEASTFPLGGEPEAIPDAWGRRIVSEKLPLLGNNRAEMALYLPETDDLVAMGYGSTACFPIVIAGVARGTVNFLGDAGIFTPALIAGINSLLPIAALIFTFAGSGTR